MRRRRQHIVESKRKKKKNENKRQTFIIIGILKNKLIKKKCNLQAHVQVANEHFCHLAIRFFPLSFLPILGRKLFSVLGEKTLKPHYHFPLILLTKHLPKNFPSFSLLPKIHFTKHALRVI